MEYEEVIVEVLDEEYKIKCAPDEVGLLKQSAVYLDEKMKKIKEDSSNLSKDKIAVLTGLNIVSEFLKQENKLKEFDYVAEEISELQNYIDAGENFE